MVTEKELHLLGHSLGINVYHAKNSKKKKDKILPNNFYRNRFCTSPGCADHDHIQNLVERGLMIQGVTAITPDKFFYVTDEGIKAFREEFKNYVINQN